MILGVDTKDHAAPAIYLLLLGDTALWRNSRWTLPFFENKCYSWQNQITNIKEITKLYWKDCSNNWKIL